VIRLLWPLLCKAGMETAASTDPVWLSRAAARAMICMRKPPAATAAFCMQLMRGWAQAPQKVIDVLEAAPLFFPTLWNGRAVI